MMIFENFPLICSLAAIIFTQALKYPIAIFSKDKKTSLSIVTTTGGMPSSHSAAVSSLITALILQYGIGSGYVAIATTFGVIVMFDSMGVRRQSGEQGIVLIDAIKELTRLSLKFPKNEQELIAEEAEEKIYPEEMAVKKYLGHKPSEVFVGLLTGIFVTFIVRMFYEQI
ncbi:hypothetical protein SDC9_194596 [bioreactor metagenome]|uniref:Divergent PAP2 family protein n=1 Tax=bioreactor metagenome TaxID=1076179 RepID=A0A645I7W2_9ZZZZ